MKKAGRYEIGEISLSRIYQHVVSDPRLKSWAVITASRYDQTPIENKKRNKELEGELRSMGLGFAHADGMWMECQVKGVEYKDCPEEMKVASEEKVFFIPNISKEMALKLGKKWDQDTILFSDKETKGKGEAITIDSKSSEEDNVGPFAPRMPKISQAYTKLKGDRVFTFEPNQSIKEQSSIKKVLRLTESDLVRLVQRIIKEHRGL